MSNEDASTRMQDFSEHLRRQLTFLENSARLFDQGSTIEAIRIATALRVLFKSKGQSVSLLKHLKATAISINTHTEPPDQMHMRVPRILALLRAIPQDYVDPRDLLSTRPIPADEWWHEALFKANDVTEPYRRCDIVLNATEKDGGAHVDAALPSEYRELRQPSFLIIPEAVSLAGISPLTMHEAHLRALRLMAHEVLTSHCLRELAYPPAAELPACF